MSTWSTIRELAEEYDHLDLLSLESDKKLMEQQEVVTQLQDKLANERNVLAQFDEQIVTLDEEIVTFDGQIVELKRRRKKESKRKEKKESRKEKREERLGVQSVVDNLTQDLEMVITLVAAYEEENESFEALKETTRESFIKEFLKFKKVVRKITLMGLADVSALAKIKEWIPAEMGDMGDKKYILAYKYGQLEDKIISSMTRIAAEFLVKLPKDDDTYVHLTINRNGHTEE